MLAYAASRPKIGARHSSPNAMLAIISVHVAVIAAVMSAKMDLPQRILNQPIVVRLLPLPQLPPPPPPNPVRTPQPHQPALTQPQQQLPLPAADPQLVVPTPPQPTLDPLPGSVDPPPVPNTHPLPMRTRPWLLTPASELRPPYPRSKLIAEEEATLRLRLTIDERGRVIAVDPIGRADPTFLDAARRYLIAHWRYRPASEDGHALGSTEVITLRFQLDG